MDNHMEITQNSKDKLLYQIFPFLGVYPKEINSAYQDDVFIVALITIAKISQSVPWQTS